MNSRLCEMFGIEVASRESHLDIGAAIARRVLDLLQVDLRVSGHELLL